MWPLQPLGPHHLLHERVADRRRHEPLASSHQLVPQKPFVHCHRGQPAEHCVSGVERAILTSRSQSSCSTQSWAGCIPRDGDCTPEWSTSQLPTILELATPSHRISSLTVPRGLKNISFSASCAERGPPLPSEAPSIAPLARTEEKSGSRSYAPRLASS